MKLKVKFSEKNRFPLEGFFIKSCSPLLWMKEIQFLGFKLEDVQVYGLPNTTPNSVWGCLVTTKVELQELQKGKHELCQAVYPDFFIPEKSVVIPEVLESDRQLLFSGKTTVYHPEIGFVTCADIISFNDLIQLPKEKQSIFISPEDSIFVPKTIKSLEVKVNHKEDVLEKLEKDIFPEKKTLKAEPLSLLEKAKLSFYKTLFSKSKKENSSENTEKNYSPRESHSWLDKFRNKITSVFQESKFVEKLQQDFEDLDKRNESELNKLMDLFKDNPEEALKYAIPLDDDHTTRGEDGGSFALSKRNNDFSLFNNKRTQGGGGSVNFEEESINKLRNQYNTTAQDLISKKEFKKAAFVYMKLLKNYDLAAVTLCDGKYYQEAATIYLKHTMNKQKAAECYEKGQMTSEAIEIYEELKKYEKVGDLYSTLKNRDKAVQYYKKTADDYVFKLDYISASSIYENKIGDFNQSQLTLLDGWKVDGRERKKCLSKYLSKITDLKRLKVEIDLIKEKTLKRENTVDFLNVIQTEYSKNNEISPYFKAMGYEIIAEESSKSPDIVNELKGFNLQNSEITTDIQRFKVLKKNGTFN